MDDWQKGRARFSLRIKSSPGRRRKITIRSPSPLNRPHTLRPTTQPPTNRCTLLNSGCCCCVCKDAARLLFISCKLAGRLRAHDPARPSAGHLSLLRRVIMPPPPACLIEINARPPNWTRQCKILLIDCHRAALCLIARTQ
jgi:hypothetical protein